MYVGESLKITCYSTTPPTWEKNEKFLLKTIQEEYPEYYSLKLINVTEEDSGKYTFLGTNFFYSVVQERFQILIGGKLFYNYNQ